MNKKLKSDIEKARAFALKKGFSDIPEEVNPDRHNPSFILLLNMATDYCPTCKKYDVRIQVGYYSDPNDQIIYFYFDTDTWSGDDSFSLRYFKTRIREFIGEIV